MKTYDRVSKRGINQKQDSTAVASTSTKSIAVNNVTIVNRDSDDLDYEDDLPLIYVKEGLKDISQGESPVGRRTRRCYTRKT